MPTEIQWTDETWNPTTGCDKVSPGCAHCYAETVALRFWPTQYPPVADPSLRVTTLAEEGDPLRAREFTDVQCHEDRLDQPLRWRKPRKVFVNSMSDLFHEDVPDAFIDKVFSVMALAPQHTFQILTKRAERMRAYLGDSDRKRCIDGAIWTRLGTPRGSKIEHGGDWRCTFPLPNVWLGASVENQHFADARIPLLLQTPAAVRFISAEPLLGPLQLAWEGYGPYEYGYLRQGIHWLIAGAESGHGARSMDENWVRALRDQCVGTGVAFFYKQNAINGRKIGLPALDGKVWNEFPRITDRPSVS